MSPSLAQLVRKWHRNYSNKNRWDFRYRWKKGPDGIYREEDLNRGLLRCWKQDTYVILIEENYACIGTENEENILDPYSSLKIIAADPRFFPKLDRMMQFLTNIQKRRTEHEQSFMKKEMALLKESLG